MGYLGRRIGLSQDQGDSNPGAAGGAVGGGLLDLLAHGYFERQGDLYNAPGLGPVSGLTATGGVISDYTTGPGAVYRAHIFTSSGIFNVTALGSNSPTAQAVDYLVVGGGGGGGGDLAGGGGAGGFRTGTALPVSISPYPVTVGGGGLGGTTGVTRNTAPTQGQNGSNSVFSSITSSGGGGGGVYGDTSSALKSGKPGGSGGGAGGSEGGNVGTIGYGYNPTTPSPVVPNIPSPHPYGITQGNNAGTGAVGPGYGAGGGGGAGAARAKS